jgi:hypothetical protein
VIRGLRAKVTVDPDDERNYVPPKVVMVDTENGGRGPDPALDQAWSSLDKLRWKAALVSASTGLTVRVNNARAWRNKVRIQGVFDVSVTGPNGYWSTCCPGNLDNTWTYLNGAETGAQAARPVDDRRG